MINFHFDLIKITNKSTVEFKIYFCILIFQFDVFIKNFIFNNEIIFVGTYFNNKLIFESIIFNNSLSFNSIKINNELHLHYVIFKKRVSFLNITFYYKISFYKISTYDDIFFNMVSFYNMFSLIYSTFNGELNFECDYHTGNLYCKNNIFYKKFNFRKSIFHSLMDLELFNNTFENIVDFSNIETFKDINLSRITVSKYTKIIFDNINLENANLYIDLNSKRINIISLKNININNTIELRNIEAEEADFKGAVINGGLINPVNFKVHKFANRESALFLKQQAYAANNAIDALQYKAQEVELHKEELINKKNKTYKDWADILSIQLSSLYSDNCQNWVKALAMTIVITAFCFTVFYIPDLTQSNIIRLYYKNWFPELIKYFIPTDYSLIIKYAASKLNLFLKIFGVLVYFLGKILFWYGSVQTVQAFRKFSKVA